MITQQLHQQNQQTAVWAHIPELVNCVQNADHIDVKTVTGNVTLRQFLANMFAYQPGWLKFLYGIRWGFVRLLGMKQENIPLSTTVKPEEIDFTAGGDAMFFEVKAAEEDHFYLAGITESHLTAHLGVIQETTAEGNRFHLITVVHYNRWTGPVYFNVIRPFHHLVVYKMGQAGLGR